MTDLDAPFRLGPFAVKRTTIREHVEKVSRVCGVPASEILGRKRDFTTARARQIVMWRAHKDGHSLPAIGRVLGRHHTTVLERGRYIERRIPN